jgi:tRNA(Arg) A34 adenosine deaminase TadA
MNEALKSAAEALRYNEVPVGAVIVDDRNNIISKQFNKVELLKDPTAHAEILAIRDACNLQKSIRLINCDIYVTLEPCAMCAQAIGFARFRRLYFGCLDEKGGGVVNGAKIFNTKINHIPEIYTGICEEESSKILKDFFKNLR